MTSKSRKRPGLCTVCDKELFEILERWPDNHPLAREPRVFGKPKVDVYRAVVVLVDGTTMRWMVCDKCRIEPENIVVATNKMLEAARYEGDPSFRENRGAEPYKPRHQWGHLAAIVRLFKNPPIGVLGHERVEG